MLQLAPRGVTNVIIEVKGFVHQAKDWRKPRRIVMVRYRPAEAEADGQGRLFDGKVIPSFVILPVPSRS